MSAPCDTNQRKSTKSIKDFFLNNKAETLFIYPPYSIWAKYKTNILKTTLSPSNMTLDTTLIFDNCWLILQWRKIDD